MEGTKESKVSQDPETKEDQAQDPVDRRARPGRRYVTESSTQIRRPSEFHACMKKEMGSGILLKC